MAVVPSFVEVNCSVIDINFETEFSMGVAYNEDDQQQWRTIHPHMYDSNDFFYTIDSIEMNIFFSISIWCTKKKKKKWILIK